MGRTTMAGAFRITEHSAGVRLCHMVYHAGRVVKRKLGLLVIPPSRALLNRSGFPSDPKNRISDIMEGLRFLKNA